MIDVFDYIYTTRNEKKYKEICSWLTQEIKGRWDDRMLITRNIDANLVYIKYEISIEDREDYIFFKMVWE